jgi:hypothetical protein
MDFKEMLTNHHTGANRMNLNDPRSAFEPIEIQGVDRWQIYHRLQELGIPCQCRSHQPLQVFAGDATSIVQLWSVTQHVMMQRSKLVELLDRCWKFY